MSRTPPGSRTHYKYFHAVTTRWLDNDAFRHVNNVNYFSFFDTAVTYFEMTHAGIDLLDGPLRCVVAEVQCRYHSSVAFPDKLEVGLRVAHIGGSSIRYELAVFREGEDAAAAEGYFIHVLVDSATQRPRPIPDALRERLLQVAVRSRLASSSKLENANKQQRDRRKAMDLGLRGRKAIVCAASKGLGRACAMSLAREGVELVITARTQETLEATAEEIRKETGAKVTPVAGDITTEEGRRAALAACPSPDILVNNAGGPPRGDFREWGRDDWIKAVDSNMLTPIFLIKAVIDGMVERKFGRIVNITSASVKSPIPELGMSNGARAGLTGFVAGIARQVARHNVTINNLLPGPFLTDRLRSGALQAARDSNRHVDELIAERAVNSSAGRVGNPVEFGDACAFLCAASSGFIVGQNLLLDGGAFNSSMG